MPRAPLPPELRDRVVRAVRDNGLSMSAAAAQFGVSKPTVRRWVDEAAAPEPPKPPSAPPPPAAPAAPLDALAATRALYAELMADAARAKEVGNFEAATRAQGHAAKLVPQLKALERGRDDDKDAVRYSRADIEKAIAGVVARLDAYRERELRCPGCGVSLAMALAGVDAAKIAAVGHPDHERFMPKPR